MGNKRAVKVLKRKRRTVKVDLEAGPQNPAEELISSALKNNLRNTLALYILATANKPVSEAMSELLNVEIQAAHLVSQLLKSNNPSAIAPELYGTLAGAFSFVTFQQPKSVLDYSKTTPQIRKTKSKRRSKLNREISDALDEFNSRSQVGVPLSSLANEVGNIVAQIMSRHIREIEQKVRFEEARQNKTTRALKRKTSRRSQRGPKAR